MAQKGEEGGDDARYARREDQPLMPSVVGARLPGRRCFPEQVLTWELSELCAALPQRSLYMKTYKYTLLPHTSTTKSEI